MKVRRLAVQLSSVIAIFSLLLFSACSGSSNSNNPPPPSDNSRNKPDDVEHRIAYSGETLAIIANWYTGKSTNWTLIRDANPGLRPERLNIGQLVRIPGELVIERNPMPRKVLQGSPKKASKNIPVDIKTGEDGGSGDETPPTNVSPPPDNLPTENPPPDVSDPSGVDLEQLLKEQIEAQKKNAPSDAPPPAEEKKPEPSVPAKGAEKAPDNKAAPGDSEREQLLDELLTQ